MHQWSDVLPLAEGLINLGVAIANLVAAWLDGRGRKGEAAKK